MATCSCGYVCSGFTMRSAEAALINHIDYAHPGPVIREYEFTIGGPVKE